MKGLMRFSCLILVLAGVLRCKSGGSNPLESPEILMGTIQGMVTAGGEPISEAAVSFGGPGIVRTTMSGLDGTFRFEDVPPGVYILTAVLVDHACESVTVAVDQTATADIVCQPVGRLVGSIRFLGGSLISGAQVAVSGPVSRETTGGSGAFVFDKLPPGDYTVAATAGGVCPSVTATIQVAQTTSVEIVCEFFGGRELEGSWFIRFPSSHPDFGDLPFYSQKGECPPPLPLDIVIGSSIAFDPASGGTISIEGLDPDVELAGTLNDGGCEDCVGQVSRHFSGSGSALRADGSSIRSELTASFWWISGYSFGGRLTRAHRDPGDNLICTEAYAVRGNEQ